MRNKKAQERDQEGERSSYPALGWGRPSRWERGHGPAGPAQRGRGPGHSPFSAVGQGEAPLGQEEQGSWASGPASGTLGNAEAACTPPLPRTLHSPEPGSPGGTVLPMLGRRYSMLGTD